MVGSGLYEYSWEQGLPVGVQKCLEKFHRRCADYLGRQFTKKWDSNNTERVLVKVGITSLLVELLRVAAEPCTGWVG